MSIDFSALAMRAYSYKRRISALRSALFRSRTFMYAPVNKCSRVLTCLFLKIGDSVNGASLRCAPLCFGRVRLFYLYGFLESLLEAYENLSNLVDFYEKGGTDDGFF